MDYVIRNLNLCIVFPSVLCMLHNKKPFLINITFKLYGEAEYRSKTLTYFKVK